MSGIDELTAAILSKAAYTPLGDYITQPGASGPLLASNQYLDTDGTTVLTLPSGWTVDAANSNTDGTSLLNPTNQFLVFKYNSGGVQQIVIAFKGSDSGSNLSSDLLDSGFKAWTSIKDNALAALNNLKINDPGYTIFADGHSLGGGMAQTFALENNLSGYGQNSLPVAPASIAQDFPASGGLTSQQVFNNAVNTWKASHTFIEDNVVGDPATLTYSGFSYISTTTHTYQNQYLSSELLGLAMSVLEPWVGIPTAATSAYFSHGISNVISSLQSGVTGTQLSGIQQQEASGIVKSTSFVDNGDGTYTFDNNGHYATIQKDTTGAPSSLSTLPGSSNDYYVYNADTGQSYEVKTTGANGQTVSAEGIVNDSTTGATIKFQNNSSGSSGTLWLPDSIISIPGTGHLQITSISSPNGEVLQTLSDYLNLIGVSTTPSTVDQLIYSGKHPTGTAWSPTARLDTSYGGYVYSVGASGAVINAPTTYVSGGITHNATNTLQILSGTGDLTQDSISNIQWLENDNPVTITAAEFNAFSKIGGTQNSITFASSGTFSLLDSRFTSGVTVNHLIAGDDGATTLIGNNSISYLYASTFGTDTLTGGTAGDYLTAGQGVDTISGGGGNDTIYVKNDLAGGTSIDGGTGNNILSVQADADISHATISNIQTLNSVATVTLSAAQFNAFTTVNSSGIIATTGGTYDMTAKGGNSVSLMLATSADGTTLIGTNTTYQTLIASADGNDTLIAGNGNYSTLRAGGGNDTLTAGNGAGDIIDASTSSGNNVMTVGNGGNDQIIGGYGNDTLIAGTGTYDQLLGGDGNDTFEVNVALGSGTVLDGGAGNNTLDVGPIGDISLATVINITGASAAADNTLTLSSAQLSQLTTITAESDYIVMNAASAGNYSLAGKSLTGHVVLQAAATGTSTLTAADGGNQTLDASESSGNVTMNGGNGDDKFGIGTGVDTLHGNDGNDTFYAFNDLTSGTSVDGGTGYDVLVVDSDSSIAGGTFSNIETLDINGDYTTLTASELSSFENIQAEYSYAELHAATAGTYSLASLNLWGYIKLMAASTGTNVLTGNATSDDILSAEGSGTDTLNGGGGNTQFIFGTGVDKAYGGTGYNEFDASNNLVSGDILQGGANGNKIVVGGDANIAAATISSIDTLEINGSSTTVTASQLNGFSDIIDDYGYAQVFASAAGTFSLSGKTLNGYVDLVAASTGTSTLTADGGNNQGLDASYSTGNVTMNGSSTSGTYINYNFGSSFGADVINNNGGSAANNEVDINGLTDQNLWFRKVGNNLEVDKLGTSNKITITNWYTSAGNQVDSFKANGLTLDSQISTLVTAMATYQSAHSSFNPTASGTVMPTDTTLQNAIASAWHS